MSMVALCSPDAPSRSFSRRRSGPCPPQCLWRLTEAAQEGATHATRVAEAHLLCDALERVVAGFYAGPRRLEPQTLDCLGGRCPSLGGESAGEVARAHRGALGQAFDCERFGEVGAYRIDQIDEAASTAAQLDERGELRLATWPALVNHELLRDTTPDVWAEIILDERECQIDARSRGSRMCLTCRYGHTAACR